MYVQVLDIVDPVIANCIIDQRRVEFVLLCDNKAQATSVMLDNPPANYVEMFAVNGDQFYSMPCFRFSFIILTVALGVIVSAEASSTAAQCTAHVSVCGM